jgi:hydroxyethylthiazole kinase-like uncharacterized protein yjeF
MSEIDAAWLRANSLPDIDDATDKNARGRVVAAGGSVHVPGALLLTGEAALRAGAGKVRIATVEPAALGIGLRFPEAAVFGLPANDDGELDAPAGTALGELAGDCDALIAGPGMAKNAACRDIVGALLDGSAGDKALLLDAALIAAAADHEQALRARRGPIVLTPHPGEMAQLMNCDASDVSPALAAQAAERFGATIVLKGAETCVACPGQPLLHYPGGGPGLAVSGSGDVLSGIIGGLLARGAPPHVAAAWGVWLHGEAGRRLADRVGPIGFLARELLDLIPHLLTVPATGEPN